MGIKDKPNKVTTVLKVVVTGKFYDDEATEETLRCAVEQDLEDAGFDVDVTRLKKQGAKKKNIKLCSNCSHSKYQAVRGTGCYDYRCKKRRMWGGYSFHCSDWAKRE